MASCLKSTNTYVKHIFCADPTFVRAVLTLRLFQIDRCMPPVQKHTTSPYKGMHLVEVRHGESGEVIQREKHGP